MPVSSGVPRTYSMAMKDWSPSSPYSYTATMPGCDSRAAACASLRSRSAAAMLAAAEPQAGLRNVFSATVRSSSGS